MADGRSYASPDNQTLEQARPRWMEQSLGHTVVAVDRQSIIGWVKMGPNRPGRGQHIATASSLVDPAHRGQRTGRSLGQYVISWAPSEGYRGIQFNAVVKSNHPAVHLAEITWLFAPASVNLAEEPTPHGRREATVSATAGDRSRSS